MGTASWYGDAFHGRRTANGEVFDRSSITAAHPTLPLPSYVRVTNLVNSRSMIVRVNDRGPYHGGRVMDVSQRVAEALDFRRAGTARVRIDYVGRAGLEGSDDGKLMATLRTDGSPAESSGFGGGETRVAAMPPPPPSMPASPPQSMRVARENRLDGPDAASDTAPSRPVGRPGRTPLPPIRPFQTGAADLRAGQTDQLTALLQQR